MKREPDREPIQVFAAARISPRIARSAAGHDRVEGVAHADILSRSRWPNESPQSRGQHLPDLAILRHLPARTHASAVEIGTACWMNAAEVRAQLFMLKSRHLVASRQDTATVPPRRVYYATAEGRRQGKGSDMPGWTGP